MNISVSNRSGIPTALIELTAEDDVLDFKFVDIETAFNGTKKSLVLKYSMVPGYAKDRKSLINLINIFMDHDPKFRDIIREFGHQRQLQVK